MRFFIDPDTDEPHIYAMASKRMKSKTFCFFRERIDAVGDSHEPQLGGREEGATFVWSTFPILTPKKSSSSRHMN